MQACVYEPALRYRCRSVGCNLRLMGPAPRISGSGTIDIGDNVQFGEGMSLLVGIGLPEQAHLEIKHNVRFTGHQEICVARRVSIGNNCFLPFPGTVSYSETTRERALSSVMNALPGRTPAAATFKVVRPTI